MHNRMLNGDRYGPLLILGLATFFGAPLIGQEPPPKPPTAAVVRLTLDEIKQRVVANNKLLNLAALNVQSKEFATKAVRANYSPRWSAPRSTSTSTNRSATWSPLRARQ